MNRASANPGLFSFFSSALMALAALIIGLAIHHYSGERAAIYQFVICFVSCFVIYWPYSRKLFSSAINPLTIVLFPLAFLLLLFLSPYSLSAKTILLCNLILLLFYYFESPAGNSLRRQPAGKNLSIAFCWSTGPVALLGNDFTNWIAWWPALFLLVLALSLHSDRVDLRDDQKGELPTLISDFKTEDRLVLILLLLVPGILLLSRIDEAHQMRGLGLLLLLLVPLLLPIQPRKSAAHFLHKESGILFVALYLYISFVR